MRPSEQHGLRRCRCGAEPRVACSDSVSDVRVWAVHCHKFCGDDTHWQMSATEAARRWNAGLVRGASGGNGSLDQDWQKTARSN
jgi:hypothetical protein